MNSISFIFHSGKDFFKKAEVSILGSLAASLLLLTGWAGNPVYAG
jgi:hypothetical protein